MSRDEELQPKREPDPSARIGLVIDRRYRILRLIGSGGMGSVYEAEHVKLRRRVALKLLHSRYAGVSEIARRFEREAFASARMEHPNCVTVSDFGELEDGTLFLIMELLEGASLADVLEREERLPPQRAAHIVRHVLRGLAAAHASGVVHRDIKPENIVLVQQPGDPDFARILDFGIAKLLGEAELEEGGDKLTRAGIAFGTPLYLAPEQATGGAVDHRADLYAVSALLFELVAGQPPFDAEEPVRILQMHCTAPIPAIADVAPGVAVGRELEEIIRRGLAKEPDERYASAEDYIAALDVYLARATIATPAAPPPPPVRGHPGIPAPGVPRTQPTSAPGVVADPRMTPYPAQPSAAHRLPVWPPWWWTRRHTWIAAALAFFFLIILPLSICSGDAASYPQAIEQLRSAPSCKARRDAVRTLHSIGDPRAIPALERARTRRGNRCLERDAARAIRDLER